MIEYDYGQEQIAAHYNCPPRNGRSPEVSIDFPSDVPLTKVGWRPPQPEPAPEPEPVPEPAPVVANPKRVQVWGQPIIR